MSAGTTKRGIRISDPDWAEFQAACKEAGVTASEVVRGLLQGWVAGERKVNLSFTSSYSVESEKLSISSLADLEALCIKHDNPLIITIGEDGKLSAVEVYDDYRE